MTTFGIYWETTGNGNLIAKDGGDDIICTVFKNEYGAWRVVVNVASPYGGKKPHFSKEVFASLGEAEDHAEHLISIRSDLKPTPTSGNEDSSPWRMQAKKANGAPTYGRRLGRKHASVRQARTGKWFFVISVGGNTWEPVGWFDSAEKAMAAFDAAHEQR
jgi:hypothetical protein